MPTIHLSPIHGTQHDLMCKMVEISVQPHSLDCPWYVWDQGQNMWRALMLSTCFVIGINNNSSSSTCFSNYLWPLNMQLRHVQSKLLCFFLRLSYTLYWTQVRSLPCLVREGFPKKKCCCSFGFCPIEGGGLCPIFLAPFISAFLVNKMGLLLPKCQQFEL